MKEHLGGIYEFLRKKNMDTLQQLEVKKAAASAAPDSLEKKGKKMDYAQRKELNKKIRYAERDLEKVEAKIAKHEARMAELEVLLVDATENIGKLYTEYETIKEEFDKLMIKWEELTEIVEKVKKEE
jgi:ATP-binding cassette subfamily F protein 3